MSLEIIYVVRHGYRSAFSVDASTGIYTASIQSPTGVPTDPPLTAYGVGQANELANHVLKLEPSVDRVYSSPYCRCLQTIQPFVAKRNGSTARVGDVYSWTEAGEGLTKIRVEGGIAEWFGFAPWEHPAHAPMSKLQGLFPDIDGEYSSRITPPRNGETLSQLHDRVATALDVIIAQCDREGHKAILLCSHAAVIIAMGRVLTGNMPEDIGEEDFAAFTCGLSTYRRRKAPTQPSGTVDISNTARDNTPKWKDGLGVGGGWTCEADSDCSFLKGGPERGWRFSGDESFSAIGNQSLAGSGAGLGVDVEVQGSRAEEQIERPATGSSKL